MCQRPHPPAPRNPYTARQAGDFFDQSGWHSATRPVRRRRFLGRFFS